MNVNVNTTIGTNKITLLLSRMLEESDADIFGFCDLSGLVPGRLCTGVSVGISEPREVVAALSEGPNMDYFNVYHSINARLDKVVTDAAELLRSNGFDANPQTVDSVVEFGNYCTAMPHKTVAVHAGLGWIGRSALFITDKYGSAIRLSSLLTDAPLETALPSTASRCGDCKRCVEACPAGAISGALWTPDTDRDELFDAQKCRFTARRIAAETIHKEITLCGKCINVCPYTQRYINSDR